MHKSDKDSLVGLIFVVAMVVLGVLTYLNRDLINPLYILGLALIVQQSYALPRVIGMFDYLSDIPEVQNAPGFNGGKLQFLRDSRWSARYIPLLGEITILTNFYAYAYIVFSALTALFLIIGYLPLLGITVIGDLLQPVLGLTEAGSYNFFFVLLGIFSYMCVCFVRGMGYVQTNRLIGRIASKMFKSDRAQKANIISMYILGFIPALRILPLLTMHQNLYKLVHLNKITQDDEYDFEEGGPELTR